MAIPTITPPSEATLALLEVLRVRTDHALRGEGSPLGAGPVAGAERHLHGYAFRVKFANWTIRVALEPLGGVAGPSVSLTAEVRSDRPLGRIRDVASDPIGAGWQPAIFGRTLSRPEDLDAALHGIRAALARRSDVAWYLHDHHFE
jgi:hypothetical protein